ncbi:DUF523 domain-containing protein [Fusobacterium varium]|uniref:DUF523 domain-containing protein n=1 Tax=Fusobacterium varium TaxID=856 RepID=UPI000BBAFEB3|nr:DUF523 domain-containing protein [uncultured Fusobacterium sp.]BBA51805.1 hypothetical protein FV113G1_21550 [Fusobacterium varium]
MKILVSACLLGVECRYNGKGELKKDIEMLLKEHELIPVCPEQLGGLATPRDPAEIQDNKIITKTGVDVTKEYLKGAEEVLKLAKLYNCSTAILKERSPSCGYGKIYDGTFSKILIDGNGAAADLLIKNGIKVTGESEVNKIFL